MLCFSQQFGDDDLFQSNRTIEEFMRVSDYFDADHASVHDAPECRMPCRQSAASVENESDSSDLPRYAVGSRVI